MDLFHTQGYVVIPGYVPEPIVAQMKELIEAGASNASLAQVRMDLIDMDPVFMLCLRDPNVLQEIKALMNTPNIRCASWSSNTLYKTPPEKAHHHWHVDYPYHDIPAPWTFDRPLGIQALWLLDDFTKENGATIVIPGSHLARTPPPSSHGSGTVVEAPKGSLMLMHSALWHTQGINVTDRSRTCLLGTFVPSWVAVKDEVMLRQES